MSNLQEKYSHSRSKNKGGQYCKKNAVQIIIAVQLFGFFMAGKAFPQDAEVDNAYRSKLLSDPMAYVAEAIELLAPDMRLKDYLALILKSHSKENLASSKSWLIGNTGFTSQNSISLDILPAGHSKEIVFSPKPMVSPKINTMSDPRIGGSIVIVGEGKASPGKDKNGKVKKRKKLRQGSMLYECRRLLKEPFLSAAIARIWLERMERDSSKLNKYDEKVRNNCDMLTSAAKAKVKGWEALSQKEFSMYLSYINKKGQSVNGLNILHDYFIALQNRKELLNQELLRPETLIDSVSASLDFMQVIPSEEKTLKGNAMLMKEVHIPFRSSASLILSDSRLLGGMEGADFSPHLHILTLIKYLKSKVTMLPVNQYLKDVEYEIMLDLTEASYEAEPLTFIELFYLFKRLLSYGHYYELIDVGFALINNFEVISLEDYFVCNKGECSKFKDFVIRNTVKACYLTKKIFLSEDRGINLSDEALESYLSLIFDNKEMSYQSALKSYSEQRFKLILSELNYSLLLHQLNTHRIIGMEGYDRAMQLSILWKNISDIIEQYKESEVDDIYKNALVLAGNICLLVQTYTFLLPDDGLTEVERESLSQCQPDDYYALAQTHYPTDRNGKHPFSVFEFRVFTSPEK